MFNLMFRLIRILYVVIRYNLILVVPRLVVGRDGMHCSPSQSMLRDVRTLSTALCELGATFIKAGQLLSYRSDIIPPQLAMELSKLKDNVKPHPFENITRQENFRCTCPVGKMSPTCYRCNPIESMFEEFERTPIASASVAQVYRAKLQGRDVAIKLLRPNVKKQIETDLALLSWVLPVVARLTGISKSLDVEEFLSELSSVLIRETDMLAEAFNMERFGMSMGEWDAVRIPRVCWEYTTEEVLVMEYIPWLKLGDAHSLSTEHRQMYASLIAEIFLKMVFVDGLFHGDPHGGNFLLCPNEKRVALLDFGATGVLDPELKSLTFRLFYAVYLKDTEEALRILLKIARAHPAEVNVHGLYAELDELVAKFHMNVHESSQAENLARIALKYGLSFPAQLTLLERAILLVQGVCKELDPDFDLKRTITTLVEDFPEVVGTHGPIGRLKKSMKEYYEFVAELPPLMRRALEQMISPAPAPSSKEHSSRSSFVIPPTLALLSAWLIYAASTEIALWTGVVGFVCSIALGYVAMR